MDIPDSLLYELKRTMKAVNDLIVLIYGTKTDAEKEGMLAKVQRNSRTIKNILDLDVFDKLRFVGRMQSIFWGSLIIAIINLFGIIIMAGYMSKF